jgi:hypothetical protein
MFPDMTPARIRKLFAEMERDGVIVRTGEMRPNRKGELEPVYVLAPEYAERYGDVATAMRDRYGTRH